jgi:hypothetical protein
MGVGVCKAGTQTCNAQGTGYGACAGEVLPSPYNCATGVDETCTGVTPPCSGTGLWAKGYGGPIDEEGNAVAVDGSGNVIVGGYSSEAINFGCGVLPTAAGEDPALFKLDPAGNCLWSKVFTVPTVGPADEVDAVAVDAAGNIYILVTFDGAVDLGGGTLTSAGEADIAVAKYDTNGNYQWANRYGDALLQIGYSIAVDPTGNVIVAGGFAGTLDFGGAGITSTSESAFVAKLTTAGAFVWANKYGNGGPQVAFGVASDPSGNVLVTGANLSVVNFGCGALTAAGGGAADAFIAKLTPAGVCTWSQGFADTSVPGGNNVVGSAITSDAQGNVITTGYYSGTVDFGGAPYTSLTQEDPWLLKLDPNGKYVWSKAPGDVVPDGGSAPTGRKGTAVAADAFGNVVMAGVLLGSADFGGGPVTSAGMGDAFVAKYDAAGNYLWAKSYGDAFNQNAKGVAVDATGNVIVTGTAGATGGAAGTGFINFGTGQVCGFGGEDIFLAKLGP